MRGRYLLVLVLLATIAQHAAAQCDGRWMDGPGFGVSGFGGTAYLRAAAEWDPDGPGPEPVRLVVGGGFSAGPLLAVWNGIEFQMLPLPPSAAGHVRAMAVFQDRLVIGLYPTYAAPCVYQWNSSTGAFEPLATEAGGILAMTVAHESLYVGGYLSTIGGVAVNNIARWNGTSWSSVGGPSTDQSGTLALITAANGDVVAGGFQWGVARYNGTTWTTLANTVNSRVRSLLELPDGSIVAGGLFTSIGNRSANNIARWDGAAWRTMGAGSTAPVRALAMREGRVIAAMSLSSTPGGYAFQLGSWGPAEGWSPLAGPLLGPLGDLNYEDSGPYVLRSFGGQIFVGGGFDAAGESGALRAAFLSGDQWIEYGNRFNGAITEFLPYEDELIAAGAFSRAPGGVLARHIAVWNGASWRGLGEGLNGPVEDITPHNGGLLASGAFSQSGSTQTGPVAFWNGNSWEPFGNMDPAVRGKLAVADGVVYVRSTSTIHHWSEAAHTWIALPSPTVWNETYPFPVTVNAMTDYQQALHIGGRYDGNLSWVHGVVMRWNGLNWDVVMDAAYNRNNPITVNRLWSVPQRGLALSGFGIALHTLWSGPLPRPPMVGGEYAFVSGLTWAGPDRMAATGDFMFGNTDPTTALHSPIFLRDGRWQVMGQVEKRGTSPAFVGDDFVINAGDTSPLAYVTTSWSRWTFDGAPWVAEHPAPASVECNQTASFLVVPATGFDPIEYRWQLQYAGAPSGWLDLTDGTLTLGDQDIAEIAGATTPQLSVTPHLDRTPFVVRAVVSNPCGSGESRETTLSMTGCPPTCDPDVNCDGLADHGDVACISLAVAGDTSCFCQSDPDFNHDGVPDQGDIADVILVVAGAHCP